MNDIKISVVVVTYNRKYLLLECIQALLKQTIKLYTIYIINNNSTDGTDAFIKQKININDTNIKIINLDVNLGGSGGFNYGMQLAYKNNSDYVWLMDDDTVAFPDSLEKLFKAYQVLLNQNIGFVCSHVDWIDRTPHKMNLPHIKLIVNDYPFNYFAKYNFFLIKSCSFVSVLIPRYVISSAGFPIKEMFIWGDDLEYFTRLNKLKFLGIYVPESIVIHKTTKNKNDDILSLDEKDIWKLYFSIRNNLYILKVHYGLFFFYRKIAYNLFILIFIVLFSKNKNKSTKVKVVIKSTISSLLTRF